MRRGSRSNTNDILNGRKIVLAFALMITLAISIVPLIVNVSAQNATASDNTYSNATFTSEEQAQNNTSAASAAGNEPSESADSNSTSSEEEQYQNTTQSGTDATGNATNPAPVDDPVETDENETASTIPSVTISGEPLIASAQNITRSFSYPLLKFEGDVISEVEVTMKWNDDGSTVVEDNRGNQLSLKIPATEGTVTLFSNSTVVDQRVTRTGILYDIYWFPIKNADGFVDRYKFILAGSNVNSTSLIFDIKSESQGEVKYDNNSLGVGTKPEKADGALDAEIPTVSDGLMLDWSDAIATGHEASFDSEKSILAIPIEKGDFIVDPYVVATSSYSISPDKALAFQDQQRLITTSNETMSRINAFYYDGSNIRYKTSDDMGDTWSSSISLSTGALGSNNQRWSLVTSIATDGLEYIHLFYWTKSGSTTTVKTKRGMTNGVDITWDSPVTLFTITNNESCSPGACVGVTATSDQDGNIFAAFNWNTTNGSWPLVIKVSSDDGQTWSDSLPQINNIATNAIGMTLIPLDSPQILFVYGKGESANLFYRIFNGTEWGAEQSISATGLVQWTRKQLSSIHHDGDGKAYIAYTNVTTTTGGILKLARFFSNGTYDGLETVESTLRHYTPNVMIGDNGDININSIADEMIHNTRRFSNSWEAPYHPYGSTFDSPDDLTATTLMDGLFGAIWREGASAPYNLVFDMLHHGMIEHSTSADLSPGDADYYDGQRRVVGTAEKTLYAFYYDGANILYKVSNDFGHTWSSEPVSTSTGTISSDNFRWSVAYSKYPGGERIALLYYRVSGSNTNFYAKTYIADNQTLYLVGTTTLFTVANDGTCNPTGTCAAAAGATDDNSTLFAAFSYKSGGTWYKRVFESSNGGQTWSSSLGQSSVSTSNHLALTITGLDEGRMLLAWAKYESSSLSYKIFDGASWGSTSTIANIGWSTNTVKQISSGTVPPLVADNMSRAYVAYVAAGNSGSLKVVSFYGNGTYIASETAEETLSHTLPSVAINIDGLVHIYTLVGGDTIYETSRNETSWLQPISRYETYLEHPDRLTAQIGGILNTGAAWSNGYTPFEIRYGGTTGGTIGRISLKQSPTYTNAYEGEKRVIRTSDAIFVFYFSGANIRYLYSTNSGASWSSIFTTSSGVVNDPNYKWTIAATEISGTKYITILYFKSSGLDDENTTFYAKRGTVSGTNISWGSETSLFTVDNECASCDDAEGGAVAATATNGYIYAAFQYEDDATGDTYYRIMRSTNGGSSWSTSLSATSAASDGDDLSMALTRLASGKMLFVYLREESALIRYRVFDGSTWSSTSSVSSSITGLTVGPNKQLTADSDSSGKPYVAYLKGGNSGELRVMTMTSSGTSPTVETVDKRMSHRLPSITVRPDNNLINIYSLGFGPESVDDVRSLYLSVKVNGYWVTPHKPYGDSPVDITSLTIGWGLGAGQYAAVTWTDGSSPYTIREMGLVGAAVKIPPFCDHPAELSNRCERSDTFTAYAGTFKYRTPDQLFVPESGPIPCENPPPGVKFVDYRLSVPFRTRVGLIPLEFAFGSHAGTIPAYQGTFDRLFIYFTSFEMKSDPSITGNRYVVFEHHCTASGTYIEYFDILYYTNGLHWRALIYSPSLQYKL